MGGLPPDLSRSAVLPKPWGLLWMNSSQGTNQALPLDYPWLLLRTVPRACSVFGSFSRSCPPSFQQFALLRSSTCALYPVHGLIFHPCLRSRAFFPYSSSRSPATPFLCQALGSSLSLLCRCSCMMRSS